MSALSQQPLYLMISLIQVALGQLLEVYYVMLGPCQGYQLQARMDLSQGPEEEGFLIDDGCRNGS